MTKKLSDEMRLLQQVLENQQAIMRGLGMLLMQIPDHDTRFRAAKIAGKMQALDERTTALLGD